MMAFARLVIFTHMPALYEAVLPLVPLQNSRHFHIFSQVRSLTVAALAKKPFFFLQRNNLDIPLISFFVENPFCGP